MMMDTFQSITPVVVQLTDFGAVPDSGLDTVIAMQRAIEAIAAMDGPVVLECAEGRYDFYSEHAAKVPYYISNTASEEDVPDITKTIGVLLQGLKDVTIEGNGSLFMFHGKFTMFVFELCENIEIRNLATDFARPTMSEMTVMAIQDQTIDVLIHPDSWYELQDGQFHWIGEDWKFRDGPAQLYDPVRNVTWRVPNPITLAAHVEELEPNRLRIHFDRNSGPEAAIGYIYQMRDGVRDQVGSFIHRSRNITWKNVSMHYMHGLGIVGQYSENLTLDGLLLAPRKGSGRTAAAFADCIHISGCRGQVKIVNSYFEGTHDDPINVHGTHLRVIDHPAPDQILVRFMHGQSYGFDAFFPGDDIDFINAQSLTVYGSHKIVTAERISPREILLTLDKPAPNSIQAEDVVENVTWTPEVEIRNNYFARVPTRGILVTTRRRVVIEENVFEGLAMSGILIADDAESWFESGMVNDVSIRHNRFIHCGGSEHPVIYIAPENRTVDEDHPVHQNIHIEENIIQVTDTLVLDAKSVRNLTFRNNCIYCSDAEEKPVSINELIRLTACSQVSIDDNKLG